MKRESKTKTFERQTNFGDVMEWVNIYVETEDHEIVYSGSEPSLDVECVTKHKYTITITKQD